MSANMRMNSLKPSLLRMSVAFSLALSLAAPAIAKGNEVDLLLRGGTVVDGSGGAPFVADVGISADRIVFVGDAAKRGYRARKALDAKGLVVAPGFIDPHTHAYRDLVLPNGRANLPYLLQGVTTVVIGNDGVVLETDGADLDRIGSTLNTLEKNGIGTNVAMLIGHNAVRHRVMGDVDRVPTAVELGHMKALMHVGMLEGAYGMSTGLVYTPGVFAKTDEVVALAKVVADEGGIYDTHMRDEGNFKTGLLNSVDETLQIGRESGIALHISHIKALGTDVWGKSTEVIERLRTARAAGMNITASQYPYAASSTHIVPGLVPGWARDGGNDALLKRLDDPATRQRIAEGIDKSLQQRNGPAAQKLIRAKNPAFEGKTVETIAKELRVSPAEAVIEVIRSGGSNIVSFNMGEADIEAFMQADFVVGGSDGVANHPRRAGTFARRIGEYVTKRHLLSLPFAVRQGSARTAEFFGMAERGRIKTGYFADIVVFDPLTYKDRASYDQPDLPPDGVQWVLVNGSVAVEHGAYVHDVLAGRALRKQNQ